MMGTCAGLVGPKSENVDFIQVFVCFFEVQGRGGEEKRIPAPQFGTPRGGIKGGVNPSSYGRWEDKITLDDSGQGSGGLMTRVHVLTRVHVWD